MKIALALLLTLCPVEGPTGGYDLSKTGLPWVQGLEAARKQGKPILLFQLLGKFDDVHC